MANHTYYYLFVFLPLTLSTCCFCARTLIEAQNHSGFSVELIHRDSTKSPFYNPTETPFQRLNNAFHRSLNRYKHFYPQASIAPNTPQSEITPIQGEYLMKYSVGTPSFEVMGIVDTGSDLIWSQCKPCAKCYTQNAPMFDPSKSSTYQPVPCNSPVCKSLGNIFCENNNNCGYTMSYGDGSHSEGDLAFDTLTLGSTTGSSVAFPKIAIGCGFNDDGTFDKRTSGLVGLGAGPDSLISQIGPSIGFKFSYCLVPMFATQTTKLNFGENAIVAGPGAVSTPIVPGPDTFYYLKLEGMSVGPTRIDFIDDSTSEGNIIIDSGTIVTQLPKAFYDKLESEVASQIKLKSAAPIPYPFTLCYEATANGIEAPIITAHFTGGADVALNSLNTFVKVNDDLACFAFVSVDSVAIFGNLAQTNYLVGYDLQKKTVSFKPTDCTKM